MHGADRQASCGAAGRTGLRPDPHGLARQRWRRQRHLVTTSCNHRCDRCLECVGDVGARILCPTILTHKLTSTETLHEKQTPTLCGNRGDGHDGRSRIAADAGRRHVPLSTVPHRGNEAHLRAKHERFGHLLAWREPSPRLRLRLMLLNQSRFARGRRAIHASTPVGQAA